MAAQLKVPTVPITELEQSAFCRTDESLASKTLAEEFDAGVRWQKLPISYLKAKPEELDVRIAVARAQLADRLVVLGHHYQRDEIIKFADLRGDSFKLSQYAASQRDAEFIVFCGVHFMAETADVLSSPEQNGRAAQPLGRLLDGRHGPHRRRPRLLGRPPGDPRRLRRCRPDHLHELYRGHQGALRQGTTVSSAPRRTRRRPSGGRSSAASACCSCPTSTSDATRP